MAIKLTESRLRQIIKEEMNLYESSRRDRRERRAFKGITSQQLGPKLNVIVSDYLNSEISAPPSHFYKTNTAFCLDILDDLFNSVSNMGSGGLKHGNKKVKVISRTVDQAFSAELDDTVDEYLNYGGDVTFCLKTISDLIDYVSDIESGA